MNDHPLFGRYKELVLEADGAFEKGAGEFPISCRRGCSDCCHAVFGLFLIEAAYLHTHFKKLERKVRRAALLRGEKGERDLRRMEERLKREVATDPEKAAHALARERVRCPLLDEHEACVLYGHRPLTCRVYGIPTRVRGKVRVCGRSGIRAEKNHPVYDLDGAFRELHLLSGELLRTGGFGDLEKASYLFSVSRVIRGPVADLIRESDSGPGEAR